MITDAQGVAFLRGLAIGMVLGICLTGLLIGVFI